LIVAGSSRAFQLARISHKAKVRRAANAKI
jgi:hypothetical protein